MTGPCSKAARKGLWIWRCPWLVWCIGASVLISAGCASVFSSEIRKEVDSSILFSELQKNPEAFQGKTVLLGGKIIEIENLAEKTMLTVLQRRLNASDKPIRSDQSEGRFMVSVQGFLDPAIYREQRLITVIGRVIGSSVLPLDGTTYRYPIIEKKELYLWPTEETLPQEPRVQFGIGIGFGF